MSRLLLGALLCLAADAWACSLAGSSADEEWRRADLVIEGEGLEVSRWLGLELVEVRRVYKGSAPRFIRVASNHCVSGFFGNRAHAFLSLGDDGAYHQSFGTYLVPGTPDQLPSKAPLYEEGRQYREHDATVWNFLRGRPATVASTSAVPAWVVLWRHPWLAIFLPLGLIAVPVLVRSRLRPGGKSPR